MENQNLAIALALVSLVTGIALLVNWSSNRQVFGLLKIALGFMANCVGILLASMQEFIPPLISVFFANALIMGGRIPVLSGLANFWNQEATKLPLFCLVWFLGTMAGFYYFTFIDESILWRTRIYTQMMLIFSASIVYILVRGLRIERKLRPVMAINTNFGAYLLLTLSLFNAVGDPHPGPIPSRPVDNVTRTGHNNSSAEQSRHCYDFRTVYNHYDNGRGGR